MKKNYIFFYFFMSTITSLPCLAYIGSAYQIEIKGIGTIILLGDQLEDRPEIDQEQFQILTTFLSSIANTGKKTVLNFETIDQAPSYYPDTDSRSSMVINRLSERHYKPNLRTLISSLHKSDLKNQFVFTQSEIRLSPFWKLMREKNLKPIVDQALKKDLKRSSVTTLGSIESDHDYLNKKFDRFMMRTQKELPKPLALSINTKITEKKIIANETFKACKKFFLKYADPLKNNSIAAQEIHDVIYAYALQKKGYLILDFNNTNENIQTKLINEVTIAFLADARRKFLTSLAGTMAHTPAIMDLFNAFTQHKADIAVFYANDSRIHALTLFLKAVKANMRDDTIIFKEECVLSEAPLTRTQFERIIKIS